MIGIPEPIRGRAAFKQLLASLVASIDDIQDTPELLIAEGDKVVIREIARGKHTVCFKGISPTGKEVTLNNNEINRIAEGKIVEQWIGFDMLRVVHQRGIVIEARQAKQKGPVHTVFSKDNGC